MTLNFQDTTFDISKGIEPGGGGSSPVIKSLSITPTTSAQRITAPSGTDGYSPVNVSAVTSAIDENIAAENIKSGVTILGTTGSVTELNGETKSVSLTDSSGQTYTPSSGKNAITSITVTPNNQNRTVTPTTSSQSLTVNSGYSGNGTITVNAVTSSIDSNIAQGNIKSGVTILGVTGNYSGQSPSISSLSITPTTSAQTITAPTGTDGYSPISVSAVTSSIDSNITAGNIKKDVSILGVTGTYEGSGGGGGTMYRPVEITSAGLLTSAKNITSYTLPSNIKDIDNYIFYECFSGNTILNSVDFSSLEKISGKQALAYAFSDCSSLVSVTFPSLYSITGSRAFYRAFLGATAIQSIYFPALKNAFGNLKDQFNSMLSADTNGCTVHFPSNLQSVLSTWPDVQSKFDGINTVVLFDLPATE